MTTNALLPSRPVGGELQLVVFELDGYRYAIHAALVSHVTWAVRPTPLPGAPPLVLGLVDVHGSVVPLLDVRRRFGLQTRPIKLTDVLLLARTERRPVALLADAVAGVRTVHEADVEAAREVLPGAELVSGVVTLEDGLVLVHDLERFLSLDQQAALDRAVDGLGRRGDGAGAD